MVIQDSVIRRCFDYNTTVVNNSGGPAELEDGSVNECNGVQALGRVHLFRMKEDQEGEA